MEEGGGRKGGRDGKEKGEGEGGGVCPGKEGGLKRHGCAVRWETEIVLFSLFSNLKRYCSAMQPSSLCLPHPRCRHSWFHQM